MTLGERQGRPAARFRFDLDLPPEALDRTPLTAELTYPEWDYRRGSYLKDHCRVLAAPVSAEGAAGETDPATKSLIRRVRRRFEVLRPRHEMLRAQIDGADLDLDAVVRARTDLRAGGQGSDRIHMQAKLPQQTYIRFCTQDRVQPISDRTFCSKSARGLSGRVRDALRSGAAVGKRALYCTARRLRTRIGPYSMQNSAKARIHALPETA